MIYILEDDSSIRELVVYTLAHSGHEAMGFEVPSQFWAQLEKALPDLVLLDVMPVSYTHLDVYKRQVMIRGTSVPLASALPDTGFTIKICRMPAPPRILSGAPAFIVADCAP